MLAHSFDRFYVVKKFILPSIGDLNFSELNYDDTCAYLDNRNICDTDTKKHMLDLIMFCKKVEPFVIYYKRLIKSYNNTAHNFLKNEIDLILPQVPRKQTCRIITTLVSSFIGLAYEGISIYINFSRTGHFLDLGDKLLPAIQHGFLRSEENVIPTILNINKGVWENVDLYNFNI